MIDSALGTSVRWAVSAVPRRDILFDLQRTYIQIHIGPGPWEQIGRLADQRRCDSDTFRTHLEGVGLYEYRRGAAASCRVLECGRADSMGSSKTSKETISA